jgi:hypothetical protein
VSVKNADVQSWLDAGYVRFDSRHINNSDYGLQKRIRDPATGDTRYFITCYVYEWDQYKDKNPHLAGGISVEPTAQFSEGKWPTTDVSLHTYDVVTAEHEFEAIWERLGQPMYEVCR